MFLLERGGIFIPMFKFEHFFENILYPEADIPTPIFSLIERVQIIVGQQLEYKVEKKNGSDSFATIEFFADSKSVARVMTNVQLNEQEIEEKAQKIAEGIKEQLEAGSFGGTEYDTVEMWVSNIIPLVLKQFPSNLRLQPHGDDESGFFWTLSGSPKRKSIAYSIKRHTLTFMSNPFAANAKHYSKNIFKDYNGDPKTIANAMTAFFLDS